MSDHPDFKPVFTPAGGEGIARISGGVGGVRFQWEELDRGAQIVGGAAAELRRIWEDLSWIDLKLSAYQSAGGVPAAIAGAPAAAGIAAAEDVHGCLRKLSDVGSQLDGVAHRIRQSRHTYEVTELGIRDYVRGVVMDLPPVGYPSGPLTLQRGRTDVIALDGTVDGLLSRVPHTVAEPGAAFEVLEVEGGSRPTYVVVIPGTEDAWSGEPFGAHGIAEAKFGDSEFVNDAVTRALKGVGAESGADVVLVGYSQGGMHAVNLANSGPLSDTYSVDLVITAGSPIRDEDVPDGTNFLHLAHQADLIPNLNILAATDRPNQVSVVLDHRAVLAEGEDFGLGPAHKLRSYRKGAQAIDSSTHPSLEPITAALGTAVAGSVAKRHVFKVTRPVTGPQPTAPQRDLRAGERGALS